MRFWVFAGRVMYFVGWPVIALALRFSYRARVIVIAKDRVLLVRDLIGNGQWSLVGGGIKRGEAPAAAAIRELYEETGIILNAQALHCLGDFKRPVTPRYKYRLFIVRLPQPAEVNIRRSELVTAAWLPIDTIWKLKNVRPAETVIRSWLALS